MVKRIGLFLLVNMLILLTISFFLSIFNIRPYLTPYGISYGSLLSFCAIWGMGGAFISLMLSRWIAKMSMGVKLQSSGRLYEMVAKLAKEAGLKKCPEVGIYSSATPNAFATGPSPGASLVAVSTGLLERMTDEELEAILGHEISHITNGDMVTMALLQGVVNVFVMFFARVLALAVSGFGKGDNRRGSFMGYYLFTFLFEIIFLLLGSLVIAWYSRTREFRADRGAARLTSKSAMIHALERLDEATKRKQVRVGGNMDAFMIHSRSGVFALFASHPPIEKRIAALS